MATKQSLVSLTIAVGLVLAAASCGDSDKAGTTPPSTSTSSTPPPSSTPTPSVPSTPPASTPAVPPATKPRTVPELTKALLALPDLPAGFSIDTSTEEDDSKLSSTNARCKDLVLLFNAKTAPGAKASVVRSYTAGQQGPYFDQNLDAMGSPAAVTALLNRTRTAIKSCKQAKLTIPGTGSSTMTISEISVPKAGANPVGVRFTANSGPLDGLEGVFAFTGIGDVVLTMSFDSSDIEGAFGTAAAKAIKTLGTAKSGT